MEVIYLSHPVKNNIHSEPNVMAIGFFDGIHLGHQQLLTCAKTMAKEKGVLFTVMTFTPHPDVVIKGDKHRKYLTPLAKKIEKMDAFGVDKLFVVKFDQLFASLPPLDFIEEYILKMKTVHVVVGFDFTFGYKAKGNIAVLRHIKQFRLSVIPKKTYLHKKISSTLLREIIKNGDVDIIPHYLGTAYEIDVKVRKTEKNGWFTVEQVDHFILPKPGTYLIEISNEKEIYHGEYYRYSDLNIADEIYVNHLQEINEADCFTLRFLEKQLATQTIFV